MSTYAPPKLRQIVTEAIFRRRKLFWGTVFVVVGLTAVLTALIPKRYQAEAKLLVQNIRTEAPLSTAPSEHLMSPNEVSTTEINSEVDLLESQGIARRSLGPGATEDDVLTLQGHLKVESVHQTNLVNVTLLGASPSEARAQLSRVIAAYFDERAGSSVANGAAGFFSQQVDAKGKQLALDQQKLTDFEVLHGIADLDDQKKLQVQRIAALEDQLAQARTALARQRSKTAADKRELSLTPARSRTTERSLTNQYMQEHLGTALVDFENRRTELLKRYPPTDRQVVEINDKIATTQKAIAAAASAPAGEQATDVNPVYQQLSSSVANSTGELSGVAAQTGELVGQVKDAKARLEELEQSTATYNELKRAVGQSQGDFTLYSQKRDESRIAEALDKAKMFDVSLVQVPMASSDPVRPKPVLYLLVAFVGSLLLGTLLALYADTSSEQVYTPSQLDSLTGMRTLATFTEEKDEENREANRLEYRRVLLAMRNTLRETDAPLAEKAAAESTAGSSSFSKPSIFKRMVSDARSRQAGHCVAFTSALAGEGVSFLVSHLATEAARQASSRVAVMDVASLLRKFETTEDVGFAMKFDEAGAYWVLDLSDETSEGGVAVVSGDTQGLFSTRLCPLLLEVRKEFDYIFLDCPSLQASTLAGELDRCVDGYVGVVAASHARKQNVDGMVATFKESRAPLLGYVLNRREYPVPRWMHRMLW